MLALPGLARSFTYTYGGQELEYIVTDEELHECSVKAPSMTISGEVVIPEIAIEDNIGYTVKEIAVEGFRNCWYMTSVSVPKTVISINRSAFRACPSLTSLKLEDGDSPLALAYNETSNYTHEGLFKACPLEYVYLGRNLTYSIEWHEGYSPFCGMASIVTVEIGHCVKTLGGYLFSGCGGLESITIPAGVTTIQNNALSGCDGLKEVVLADGDEVLKAGMYYDGFSRKNLFFGCPVETVYIGRHIERFDLGSSPFCDLATLRNITFGDNITTIDSSLFSRCTGLTSLTIGDNITSIGNDAFYGCTGLTSLKISDSVTSIDWSAFEGCTALSSVKFGNSVALIYFGAFQRCTGLSSVTIPGSVRNIGFAAFRDCTALEKVYMISPVPPVIGGESFDATANLYVPEGSKDYYMTHNGLENFSNFAEWNGGSDIRFETEGFIMHVTSQEDAIAEIAEVVGSASGTLQCPDFVTYGDRTYRVTGLANGAFQGKNFTSVTLPSTVDYIGLEAMSSCSGLRTLTVDAQVPPLVARESFAEETFASAALNVPGEALEEYLNDEVWKLFGTINGASSIEDVESDFSTVDNYGESEVFTISGVKVGTSPDGLVPGIYIVRRGDTVKKVVIR